ncbi:MAG TPA: TonB-dependent receptor, partial [Oceanospirillales bacterium]|nr:TonB-dependent receptor [Oceanospirillales bacterium]
MSFKRLISTAAITSSFCFAPAHAAEVVFYITEDGSAADAVSVAVNGQRQIVNPQGFVTFELPADSYIAELSQYGAWVGEADFTLENDDSSKDVFVEILGGEAIAETSSSDASGGVIKGQLISNETGGPVSGARVSAAGTDLGVITDDDGNFSLELPRGSYTLTVAHPSYQRAELNVNSMPGVPVDLNVEVGMSGNGVIEEVVAVGTYVADSATSQERDASAVLDSIGAEQMSQFGDSSAASALKRVAGVAVVGGQFAVVRGLQGRYISSTLNGGLMPSTDPLRRDVPLDLFPANVLGGINIQKSYTPELPGDTTGGIIMMTTKDLPDGPVNKIKGSLGINMRTTFSDVAYYDGSETDWMGIDDGTRDLPAAYAGISNNGEDAIEVCTFDPEICTSPEDATKAFNSFDHNFAVKNVQAKPEKSIAYQVGTLRDIGPGDLGYYAALQYKDKWTARHDAEVDDLGVEGTYERTKRNIDATGYFVVGYEDENMVLNSKTTLLRNTENTIKVAQLLDVDEEQPQDEVILQWVERQFLAQHFLGEYYFDQKNSLDWRINLGQTKRNEPDRRTYQYLAGNLSNSTVERRFSELVEDSLDIGFDYKYETNLSAETFLKLKFGAMASEKDRDVTLVRVGMDANPASGIDFSSGIEEIINSENVEDGFVRYQSRTAGTDSYTATDSVTAYYGSFGLDFYSLQLLAGARSETSEQTLTYPNSTGDESSLSSTNILPMFSMNYQAMEDLQLRFAASQTISRPGLTERSLSVQFDPDTDEAIIGNPDLIISEITNIDVRSEYYFSESESMSLAYFIKDITAPIERTIPDGSGSAAQGVTFRNEDSATVSGLEFDIRKNFIETIYGSAFVAGNLALIDAEVTLSDESARFEGRDTRRLQGQSETLANVQLGFDGEEYGHSLTLLV